MTAQEQNERLAAWAGLECRCYRHHGPMGTQLFTHKCSLHPNPPDYDRDEVAISLFPTLAGKGYFPEIFRSQLPDWRCAIYDKNDFCLGHSIQPTIASAITSAILNMLDKENQ